MVQLRERVLAMLRQSGAVERGSTMIVSVSGGPDSCALLHLLHRIAPDLGVKLHIFHMDHGLRGAASGADAAFVAALGERFALPFTIVQLPPGSLKAQPGSLQANARVARHAALEGLVEELGASLVALGHHRDDQAETLLLRLLRGAGSRGLGGMAPVRKRGKVTYLRPLLAVSRKEIEAYCAEHQLAPRLDESNLSTDYLRNQIRLDLLPKLAREYNPAIARNLAQTAALLREEDEYLDALASQALDRCQVPAEGIILDCSALLTEPPVLARRVLRLAARATMGHGYELGAESVVRLLNAASKRAGTAELSLPGGLQATFTYGHCQLAPAADDAAPPAGDWPILAEGETNLSEIGLVVKTTRERNPSGPWEAAFDPDLLPGPLSIRFRRPGDRIWPTGMAGSKKLQDILVDAKVPRLRRDWIPLLTSGEEVLWIIGYRLDRRFLATAATKSPLLVQVHLAPLERGE